MIDRQHPPKSLSVSRRSFFRELLRRGLEEAESTSRELSRRISDAVHQHAPPPPPLRPPGALPPPDFADLCSRCGDCVKACPAQCIILDEHRAGGLPHIVAPSTPCVVCSDLACMKACPTGALQDLPVPTLIRMGTAVMNFNTCVRT